MCKTENKKRENKKLYSFFAAWQNVPQKPKKLKMRK